MFHFGGVRDFFSIARRSARSTLRITLFVDKNRV